MTIDELVKLSNLSFFYIGSTTKNIKSLESYDLVSYIGSYIEQVGTEDAYILSEKGIKIYNKWFLKRNPIDLLKSVYEVKNDQYYQTAIMHVISDRKGIEKLVDLSVDWINKYRQNTLFKMLQSRDIQIFNLLNATKHFYPNPIPEKIKIYRGIKAENHIEKYHNMYTSWTFDIEQADRFSKYHFDRYRPIIADNSIILELEVNLSDIDIVICYHGNDEEEVILKDVYKRFKPIIHTNRKNII